jgi:hypothetical protein
MRRLAFALLFVAAPALAQEDEGIIRLACRADNPALGADPMAFSIDTKTLEASETVSGKAYGVIKYRDGFGLYDPAVGRSQVIFRIDRVTGRMARIDKQIRLDGSCEKVERKF